MHPKVFEQKNKMADCDFFFSPKIILFNHVVLRLSGTEETRINRTCPYLTLLKEERLSGPGPPMEQKGLEQIFKIIIRFLRKISQISSCN